MYFADAKADAKTASFEEYVASIDQREAQVSQREAAVALREADVARREAAVALREAEGGAPLAAAGVTSDMSGVGNRSDDRMMEVWTTQPQPGAPASTTGLELSLIGQDVHRKDGALAVVSSRKYVGITVALRAKEGGARSSFHDGAKVLARLVYDEEGSSIHGSVVTELSVEGGPPLLRGDACTPLQDGIAQLQLHVMVRRARTLLSTRRACTPCSLYYLSTPLPLRLSRDEHDLRDCPALDMRPQTQVISKRCAGRNFAIQLWVEGHSECTCSTQAFKVITKLHRKPRPAKAGRAPETTSLAAEAGPGGGAYTYANSPSGKRSLDVLLQADAELELSESDDGREGS